MSLAKVMAKEKNITVDEAAKLLKDEDNAYELERKKKTKAKDVEDEDDDKDDFGRPKLKSGKYIKQRKSTKPVSAGKTAKLKAYLGI